jgi:hypothetical protein
MAAHRKLDPRRVYLCSVALRKRASLVSFSHSKQIASHHPQLSVTITRYAYPSERCDLSCSAFRHRTLGFQAAPALALGSVFYLKAEAGRFIF